MRLYSQNYSPFVKTSEEGRRSAWTRLDGEISFSAYETGMELRFSYTFPSRTTAETRTFFAFALPWSFTEHQACLEDLERRYAVPHNPCRRTSPTSACSCRDDTLYFHRDVLTHSLDGRPIDLLTITSLAGARVREDTPHGLFPVRERERSLAFHGKKAPSHCN